MQGKCWTFILITLKHYKGDNSKTIIVVDQIKTMKYYLQFTKIIFNIPTQFTVVQYKLTIYLKCKSFNFRRTRQEGCVGVVEVGARCPLLRSDLVSSLSGTEGEDGARERYHQTDLLLC